MAYERPLAKVPGSFRNGINEGQRTPKMLVRLKHETRTTPSYAGRAKRAEFMRLSAADSLPVVRWKNLEERIYRIPFYKTYRNI
jgi:hypothetical protein